MIATRSTIRRATDPISVAQTFTDLGASVRVTQSTSAAVEEALSEASAAELGCVTGSLYVVAEARAWLLGIPPDGMQIAADGSTAEREKPR